MNQDIKNRINEIKSGQVLEGYKKTLVGIVPKEWVGTTLSEIFIFKNGLNKEKEAFGTGTPIVNYVDVYKKRGLKASDLLGRVTLSKREISNYNVRKGDVFFTRTSETIDEIGLSSVILDDVNDTVFSGFILRARPYNDRIITEYNQYCYSSSLMRHEIKKKSSCTTRALTNGNLLGQVNINLPSKTEQAKIAEILMKWDEAIEAQQQLIQKLEIRKKALMQKLLNPINNNYSLDYLLQNKHLRLIKPKELGEFLGNRFYLSTSSIIYDKIVSNEGIISYHYRPSRAQMKPINKSVWFAKMKNSIKVMLASKKDENTYVLSTGFYGFIANEKKINNMFLKQIFLSEKFNIQKDNYAEGSSQNGIKDNNLSDIYIPLPNINEQKRIANILSLADKGIELHKQQLEQLTKQRKSMMQLLLTGIVRVVA